MNGLLSNPPIEDRLADHVEDDVEDHWQHLSALAETVLSGERASWDGFWTAIAPEVQSWVARLPFFFHTGQCDDHHHDVCLEVWEKLQRRDYDALRRFFASDKARSLMATKGAAARAAYFRAWLRVLVRRVGQDHARKIPEHMRKSKSPSPRTSGATRSSAQRTPSSPQRWRQIEQLTTGKAANTSGAERKLAAEEIYAILDEAVDVAGNGSVRRILALQHQGMGAAEIAVVLHVGSAEEVEALVCAAGDRVYYRVALEMWCAGYSSAEIAHELGLREADHANRIIKAAKAYLRRRLTTEE